MPGLIDLYVTTANIHINEHVRNGTPHRISRSKIEFEIMEELDKAPFATDLKIAWYYAILTHTTFLSFWAGMRALHNLPPNCIVPYAPDITLLQYIAPPSPIDSFPAQTTTHPEISGPNDAYILNDTYAYAPANEDRYTLTPYIAHTPATHISPNSNLALTQAAAVQEAVYDREDTTYRAPTSGKRKRTTSANTPSKSKAPAKAKAKAAPKTTKGKSDGTSKPKAPRKPRAKPKLGEVVVEGGDTPYRGSVGKKEKAKKVAEGGEDGAAVGGEDGTAVGGEDGAVVGGDDGATVA